MNDLLPNLPWSVLFLPLLSAVAIALFTKKNRGLSAGISIGAIVISFLLSAFLFFQYRDAKQIPDTVLSWVSVGNLSVDIGIKLDSLSLLMLLIVTGVGSAIHIYSWGYMHEDRAVSRYFASLSLFTFSMLGIVLATNFFQIKSIKH